ncbi:nucleotide sugar dehydrogenase [Clostridium tertium]|jgi:UDP-N-acetyl-D-mannosaminuronic acid dehydrogenase|uniref:nucleotide sugar dehydrogenase n=1 Tax=Clostridium TaxID=1485 RepID=UPI0018A9B9C6|nr:MULTISPECIES: nucleotide sugar dehydrogenase [Clostridium]MBU6134385.1 nucleotide sugar dehydrogenase [Clostridium tertium]MCR1951912.1 nucleotide sugar dehydrogenase [Clostridium sp. DSM 100503]MDB1934346.1 nucleotide sugar dehydrogenase [Clostridium tertium]MDB1935847.1 nucleotide sugar dehydrogenase [Clostridium tertium]MDB1953673.1 nucleotide sugar dehydrogenase [Clostridium tertium]
MKALNIIGLGYIGLPTTLIFAASGMRVVGTDLNENLVDTLNNGELTFDEEGLEGVFKEALKNNVKFSTEYEHTDKYIITVPTPYIKDNKKIDARYVVAATKKVLEVCEEGTILVIESTISPGTIDSFIRPIIEEKGFIIGEDIHIVHAPERIIPGKMISELKNNSRTIGADSYEIANEVKSWYESFCNGEIVLTDIKTAEMSKVVENTFRDINIAFANELAKMCNREGMDVYELIRIANKHPRVNILQPGPGVGGHCISVDPWFLVGDYPDIVNVVLGAREVNDGMPQYVFERIHEIMKVNKIKDYSKVGLYGITYKENVDDMRESPTLQLLDICEKYNIDNIKMYDPLIKEKKFNNQCSSLNEFINETELIVVLVSHSEIIEKQELLKDKIIYDTKNIINFGKIIYKI